MIARLLERAPRYACVGAAGLVVDLGLLVVLVEVFDWSPVVANVGSFTAAVAHNYTLNRLWTYRDRRAETSLVTGAAWFVTAALGGLALSEAVLVAGGGLGVPYGLAKLAAVGIVFMWNFLFNTLVTFRALPLGHFSGEGNGLSEPTSPVLSITESTAAALPRAPSSGGTSTRR